ncbi:MAG: hypothetical protein EAZ32_06235 [Cytophagia bacterium]|nr:MAG: hypothetical protein EAZ32_06235 [Cytophagia bacterium]
MAKNTGVIQLQGNVGNLNFTKGGQVRQKPASRPATAVRTLENNSEFKTQTKGASLVGEAFRGCITNAKSSNWHNRLSQVVREIIKLDLVNPRGQRGIIDDETSLIEGYEFNENATLGSILYAQLDTDINRITGVTTVKVPSIVPAVSIAAPQGATHIKYIACSVAIDFELEETAVTEQKSSFVTLNNVSQLLVTMNVPQAANEARPILVGFGIEFYQEVNGQKYLLQNGQYNPFAVVKVDTGVV